MSERPDRNAEKMAVDETSARRYRQDTRAPYRSKTVNSPPTRREELLQNAARLFRTFGYHGTSMQQLADAIGLEKSSLYHHISSKEELVNEILITGLSRIKARLDTIVDDPSLSPGEKLARAVCSHVEAVCEDLDASVSLAALTDGQILSPELRSEYLDSRDAYERRFRSIIQSGVDSGTFRPCDVSIVTKAVLGMVGWVTVWYRADGRLSADEIAAEISNLVLTGLVAADSGG